MRGRTRLLTGSAIAVACLLVLSCAHYSPIQVPVRPNYQELKQEELATLAETDPEECIEAISVIATSDPGAASLNPAELKSLALQSTEKIIELLSQSVKKNDWVKAERYYSSLDAIKGSRDTIFSESADQAAAATVPGLKARIFVSRAAEYSQRGLYAPAMLYFQKAVEAAGLSAPEQEGKRAPDGANNPIPDETLAEWVRKAAQAQDEKSFLKLGALLPTEEFQKIRAESGIANKKNGMADMVSGVVTVYVDRGLKIENGVGYPDRVVGTAFQVDAAGYYLTNYHVIQSEVDPEYNGYSRLSVRPSGNPDARIPATVIGWDEDLDLALIKSSEISPYTFQVPRTSEAIEGQRVFAIGSPVGLENSVTAGIVSAKARRFLPRGEAIQIDVPVNPGNSGGPLVDGEGNIVGVVFAGLSEFQGINFALPVSWISTVFASLFDGGAVAKPWIGVLAAKNLDSTVDIVYSYPAFAGLSPGDTLLSIDGQSVSDIPGAQMLISQKPLNSLCMLTIKRNGSTITVFRKLSPIPSMPFKKAIKLDSAENLLAGATGMTLEHVSGPRGEGGVYKVGRTWPAMPADESGISSMDTLKLIRYSADMTRNSLFFDVSVKSRATGYLERTLRMSLSLEMANFL